MIRQHLLLNILLLIDFLLVLGIYLAIVQIMLVCVRIDTFNKIH